MGLLRISIVTPSFNQGQYLEKTISSIFNQNYPNLEYIIIDGGSTDDSVKIIKKYEKHLKYWISEPDNGQAHAINKGLKITTGEIFNWLNSDDYLEPGALRHIGKTFSENSKLDVLCGYTHCFYEESGQTSHTYRMGLRKTATDTILNVEMNQPGTFYKTSVVKELGGINETLRYVFDNELWMRYLSRYGFKNVVLIDDLLAHFRLHGSSKSIGEGYVKFHEERNAIIEHIAKQLFIPVFLLEKLKKFLNYDGYVSEKWVFSELDKELFTAYIADQFQFELYKDFEYKQAVWCLKQSIRNGHWQWNKKYLALFAKLFLINRRLLNRIRKSR